MTPTLATPGKHQESSPQKQACAQGPTLLHEFFELTARRWPERMAIEVPPGADRADRRQVTFGALKRQSDALAHFLRNFVTKEECVVAILLPRNSEHLYLAQLAALKAGAAYTCIDPAFPDEQVSSILEDAEAVAVLTDRAGLARVPSAAPGVMNAIEWLDRSRSPSGPPPPPPFWLTPNSLAYIIYTSGTTGRPKGVMIEHRSVANLVKGDLQEVDIRPEDRVGQHSSSAYDSSVEEIWFAFAAGATLVVMDDETTRLGPDLVPWMRRERITVFSPSPTLLRTSGCDHPEDELPDLRLLHVGGEALPLDVAERWALGRRLVNDYGPTECTVTALRGRIEPGGPITIGRPVPGLRAWVLNDALEEVAEGEPGELCLGGVGLARGYRKLPDLTAQKFPSHPRLGRIYRTGDLVQQNLDGTYTCQGRIDAQVKVRGYRIELEAIEARLVECHGVRAAACRVQSEGAQQRLVALVVPEDGAAPPSFDQLKLSLRKVLPIYMVPSRFGLLDKLPTTTSGKLNRKDLPVLAAPGSEENGHCHAPRDRFEEKLALAYRHTLGIKDSVSVDQDFFHDLGGDSLLAAQLISRLRDDAATASLTVRDLYESRTVAALAKRVRPESEVKSPVEKEAERATGRPVLATLVQVLWLVLGLMLGAPLAYLLAFDVIPDLIETLGLIPSLLLAPLFYAGGLLAYALLTVAGAVLVKKLLIGRYRPLRAPVWGSFYVRNWMVRGVVRLIPWGLLEGTVFQQSVLRALGARIGRRVHIHRGVNLLQGGWDLLDIGDDVTLSQDAALRLVELDAGQILVGPITLGNESTLDVRAGVAGNTCLEDQAYLAPLSFLPSGGRIPQGECWDGVPAKPAGQAPGKPTLPGKQRDLSPTLHGLALSLGRNVLGLFEALPLLALCFAFVVILDIDAEDIAEWLDDPSLSLGVVLLGAALVLLVVPLTLLFQALALRALGRVRPGLISRWSLGYVRVWLKAGIVESANEWLNGTLLWPHWLRFAGMKIGRGCEISSIVDTIPELVEIGSDSFLADYIYLAGPRIHRGLVTLAPVRLGKNTYFGNNVLIAAGQTIPEGVLLGVSTAADDTKLRPGTSWFGHPPFELPRREVVTCDPSLTVAPSRLRYLNRVFWEWLRFALPLVPFFIVLAWVEILAAAEESVSFPVLLLCVVPLLEIGVVAVLGLLNLALKWALLGRVRPGIHPLWSSWCRRWEFHYTFSGIFSAGPLSVLDGTLLLNWYLRAMGMRIGRHVALGSGFTYIIDHDMLEFEDGATVSCLFQAHTFEDRVLKIDRVKIRREATVGNNAVLLYGADIGVRTHVTPHSVVMKHERLLSGCSYVGCPTRLLPQAR